MTGAADALMGIFGFKRVESEMKTVEIKVSDLEGAALDWAVAKADGGEYKPYQFASNIDAPFWDACVFPDGRAFSTFRPSTDWSQGGPLIEKYNTWPCKYSSACLDLVEGREYFVTTEQALDCSDSISCGDLMEGPTPLIAAMRAIVASKLGEVVSVPVELLP